MCNHTIDGSTRGLPAETYVGVRYNRHVWECAFCCQVIKTAPDNRQQAINQQQLYNNILNQQLGNSSNWYQGLMGSLGQGLAQAYHPPLIEVFFDDSMYDEPTWTDDYGTRNVTQFSTYGNYDWGGAKRIIKKFGKFY